MRHLACLLLVGSLLVQQAALPHSHAGSGVMAPGGHDFRPHIHVSRHGHHHHADHPHAHARHGREAHDLRDHDGAAGWCHDPLCDHDHDAVYLDVGGAIGLVDSLASDFALANAPAKIPSIVLDTASAWHFTWAPPRYGERVPVFLASTKLLV